MSKQHIIFDTEIIGTENPKFLICTKVVETGKKQAFWQHKPGHMKKFAKLLADKSYTWVGFNSENFDRPVIAVAMMGCDAFDIKRVASEIVDEEMRSWQTYKEFSIDFIDYDHIDLFDVAPGVKLSLKLYAGRMGHPTMVDMPFHHSHDMSEAEEKVAELYCHHDCEVTEALFKQLSTELQLRDELTAEYGIDLRSKSDAQIAEAILRNKCGIGRGDKLVPNHVTYTAPPFIATDNEAICEIIDLVEHEHFKINFANGNVIAPSFLEEPLVVGSGSYQMGIGGLHSTHDIKTHLSATDKMLLSDFDVASYYPNIMMKAGLIPRLGGNKGVLFLDEYKRIYDQRMEAKRSGNKKVANSLKITLNGTFGKLGNIYCSFYSPDLMLAVTLSGQLNLLCLIHELEKIKGVQVRSANTDGVLVAYPPSARKRVLAVFTKNSKRTGFEYEETPYEQYAAKDVNNYLALVPDGVDAAMITPKGTTFETSKAKVKRKGIYGEGGLKPDNAPAGKNPTMNVCANMAIDYLREGIIDISRYTDIRDFVEVRSVKGGGVQPERYVDVDDWVLVKDLGSAKNEWMRQKWLDAVDSGEVDEEDSRSPVKRKSRPKPVQEGRGGVPFGRVARWYMTTEKMPALHYVKSGNKVPTTDGARLCMNLPKKLPSDLDKQWYIDETLRCLTDMGVDVNF